MMTIHFYLNNNAETPITTFYDVESNPFKVGDVIQLDVDEIYPIEIKTYKDSVINKIYDDQRSLEELFRHKEIKIVRENKYVNIKMLKESRITIEYHCELINPKSVDNDEPYTDFN